MAKQKRTKVKEYINNHYENDGYVVSAHPRDFGNEFDIIFIFAGDELSDKMRKYRTYHIFDEPSQAYEYIRMWDPTIGGGQTELYHQYGSMYINGKRCTAAPQYPRRPEYNYLTEYNDLSICDLYDEQGKENKNG